jgi:hypothetical protein
MARGGMRISEGLNIKPGDVEERKIIITEPMSGKETGVVHLLCSQASNSAYLYIMYG